MNNNILISTKSNDAMSQAVAAMLTTLGFSPHLYYAATLPMQDKNSIYIDESVNFHSENMPNILPETGFRSIWMRRPDSPYLYGVNTDEDDRKYINEVLYSYSSSLMSLLVHKYTRTAFWVNTMNGRFMASSKALQLKLAKEEGLSIPPTVITNSPVSLRRFHEKHGALICKPLVMGGWGTFENGRAISFAAKVDDIDDLPDDSILIQPAIYQPYIDKLFEIRATFFGGVCFSVAIDTQSNSASKIDSRGVVWDSSNCTPFDLPNDIQQMCQSVMRSLGIVYATADFIVNKEGEVIFLEMNEAGQSLFMEQAFPGFPILHSFSHFLAYGNLENWHHRENLTLIDIERSDIYKELRSKARLWVSSPSL
ncbi:hypothetical protein UCD39_09090 [Nitrospirillum sp. BR 11752]|uniref:ATP-grasp domain-containing protein n=1 Tax=Nitrospirillum sp. BR 11752 TaxID=3104293 RepID=UPI002ECAB025|nr:hypothetical protein [Nitrospirillum sp. BR 11752]